MSQSLKLLKVNERDNVAVTLSNIVAGEELILGDMVFLAMESIPKGHKIAIKQIVDGENVIKYGFPIGKATEDIAQGSQVHTQNIKTNLGEILDYTYEPSLIDSVVSNEHIRDLPANFMGYIRPDGAVGVRNEIWIITTVGCVNKTSEILVRETAGLVKEKCGGVFTFTHPYGCSQLGEDHLTTQKILANLVKHPNAAGVLVLGLGCENNNIPEFKKLLGDYSEDRVKFLVCQEVEDEIQEGIKLIKELAEYASTFKRTECSISRLVVGLKCGGSDAFSGITANPLVGVFSDLLISNGGTSILTEVPEMFGAETILMNRCQNDDLFDNTVKLINDFKEYYIRHDQVVYENPSPGNKKGGISTLEEKSLGCTQKGGTGSVTAVLDYTDRVFMAGLNLLKGPGNDIVATTALTAAGAHIVLFTTGRGTPLGGPVPTIKISTNSELFINKKNWMDFNAGQLLEGVPMSQLAYDFYQYVIDVASGDIKVKNEENGYREIAIFKDGVTL